MNKVAKLVRKSGSLLAVCVFIVQNYSTNAFGRKNCFDCGLFASGWNLFCWKKARLPFLLRALSEVMTRIKLVQFRNRKIEYNCRIIGMRHHSAQNLNETDIQGGAFKWMIHRISGIDGGKKWKSFAFVWNQEKNESSKMITRNRYQISARNRNERKQ